MLDDAHFLAAKRATQDEFLHTFNSLILAGAPVVLALDRHPRQIPKLAEELVTRFLGGMVVKLEAPDYNTRLAILRSKALSQGVDVPEAVLTFVAEHVRSSVRELEGALCSVLIHAQLTNRPLDVVLARTALRETIRLAADTVALHDVEQAVCHFFELTPEVLRSDGRARAVSYPRMLAMYLARKHTGAPYSEIGRHFGGRNHSTVIAAERKLNAWLRNQEHGAFLPGMESVAEVLAAVEKKLHR
jgi:chromosomal replication initiator protein